MIYRYQNIPIYYETFGQGPAVVLLHGFLETSTMWQPFIPKLSEKNTLITIDLPGHGKSGLISETHSMELMAEVVNDILQHLQIPSATFIGHSMGGYVVLAYAEMFPEKVQKLILLNSTPAADSEERKETRNRSLKVMDKNPKAYINMAIGNLFAETSRDNFAAEIEALKEEALSFPVEGLKAAIKGMRDRTDRAQVLKNFTRERHMILAKADPILSVFETKKLAVECGASVKIIEGGHMSTIEKRDFILKFLLFNG